MEQHEEKFLDVPKPKPRYIDAPPSPDHAHAQTSHHPYAPKHNFETNDEVLTVPANAWQMPFEQIGMSGPFRGLVYPDAPPNQKRNDFLLAQTRSQEHL